MENKLRKKFIYFSVGIISIVTVIIIGFVNFAIFYNLNRNSDELLKTLAENNGVMPKIAMVENSDYDQRVLYLKNISNRFFTKKYYNC